jgi:hypothetical protein
MIFIVFPPLRFFYFVCFLAWYVARAVPEFCVLFFQEVTIWGAVFSLHEGAQDITAEGRVW